MVAATVEDPGEEASASASASACSDSDSGSGSDWLQAQGGLDGAFDRPFASHSLVFTNTHVADDEIIFSFRIVDDGDGETVCEISPALRTSGLNLRERLFGKNQGGSQSPEAASQAVLALGMSVLCYVWMGFLCPKIRVQPGAWSFSEAGRPLEESQLSFWKEVLLKSLREHFFVNGVWTLDGKGGLDDISLSCDVDVGGNGDVAADSIGNTETADRAAEEDSAERSEREPYILVPMGAGKDSTVAWELLGKVEPMIRRRWFFLEGSAGEFQRCWRYGALAEASGVAIEDVLVAEFVWPASTFERYRNSALQMVGHPWAAIVCFASVVVALGEGASHVAVGNERSAGLGNGVLWEGVEVNHQWDKAYVFEKAAAAYLVSFCNGAVKYFSVLSPIWDLQVAMLFQRLCSRYSSLIVSCNQPQGPCASRWCGTCAKCAFVAAALGAFFPVSETRALFGDDPFESGSLTGHLDLLAGLPPEAAIEDRHATLVSAALPAPARGRCKVLTLPWKPLECVGGAVETKLALRLVEEKYLQEKRRLPAYFTSARRSCLAKSCPDQCQGQGPGPGPGPGPDPHSLDVSMLRDWSEEHLLPEWLAGVVQTAVEEAATDFEHLLASTH